VIAALPLTVLVPLVAATATFLARGRLSRLIALAGVGATTACAALVVISVGQGQARSYRLGDWGAPVGIELAADGLSALFLAMTTGVALLISVHATGYFRQPIASRFWPLWLFTWGALNAIYLSADAFNLYVALEVMALAAVALVCIERGAEVLRNGLRYLLAATLGSFAYLFGVSLIYSEFDTLSFAVLAEVATSTTASTTGLMLITVGLALKTALFPLHFWLPPAHASAPAPVSAALSALVTKASFFLLIRWWFDVLPTAVTPTVAQVVGALGLGAVLWGSIEALRTDRLKLLVAHSTVSQVGYFFLFFPLVFPPSSPVAAGWDAPAASGAVMYAMGHGLAKAALFLAAGNVVLAVGNDRIDDLRGMASRLPVSMFAFAVAGVSLVGLPPSAGFVGKWLMLVASVETGQWWWLAVLALGGILTAAYLLRVARIAFSPVPDEWAPPTLRRLEWAPMALAMAALLLGLRAIEPLTLLGVGGSG
jgi:multicomponent Na+:H+ antiporter subunit D